MGPNIAKYPGRGDPKTVLSSKTSLHSRNLMNIVLDSQKRLPIKPFISKFNFHIVKFKTCLEIAMHIAQNVVAHISDLYM